MALLSQNSYGKAQVRLVKVLREQPVHSLRDWTVKVMFRGDFSRCFTEGDNSRILPTDTMKNTVYSIARSSRSNSIEEFGGELAEYFLTHNPQISGVEINFEEKVWENIAINGVEHPSTFIQASEEIQTCTVTLSRGDSPQLTSGLRRLIILKTANSSFEGFLRDRLTTLKETSDRLFGTELSCEWRYNSAGNLSFEMLRRRVREAIIRSFSEHDSMSVQHTLYAVAEGVLDLEPAISEVHFSMPNLHCNLVDLSPFGQDNPNQIFVPTDQPHGLIEATVNREVGP